MRRFAAAGFVALAEAAVLVVLLVMSFSPVGSFVPLAVDNGVLLRDGTECAIGGLADR